MPCFPYPEENKRSFMRFLLLLAARRRVARDDVQRPLPKPLGRTRELTLRADKVARDQNGIAADTRKKKTVETFEYKPGLSLTMMRRGGVPRPAALWIHGGG